MSEYTTGYGDKLEKIYAKQVCSGTRDNYVWEYFDGYIWCSCLFGGAPCSPNWNYNTDYRYKLKTLQVDSKDKLIANQAEEIRTLKELLDEFRTDYKKSVEDMQCLIIDLAPTLNNHQLRMVGARTGDWFVVLEPTTPVYFICCDPRTGK